MGMFVPMHYDDGSSSVGRFVSPVCISVIYIHFLEEA